MPKQFILMILGVMLLLPSCAMQTGRTEFDFGNSLARENLWNEALFRYQRALLVIPQSAALHNNLALTYEQLGRMEEAEKEYRTALRLDPGNTQITSNLERFEKAKSGSLTNTFEKAKPGKPNEK